MHEKLSSVSKLIAHTHTRNRTHHPIHTHAHHYIFSMRRLLERAKASKREREAVTASMCACVFSSLLFFDFNGHKQGEADTEIGATQ